GRLKSSAVASEFSTNSFPSVFLRIARPRSNTSLLISVSILGRKNGTVPDRQGAGASSIVRKAAQYGLLASRLHAIPSRRRRPGSAAHRAEARQPTRVGVPFEPVDEILDHAGLASAEHGGGRGVEAGANLGFGGGYDIELADLDPAALGEHDFHFGPLPLGEGGAQFR